ncbi:MAG: cache domain-containing protein [Bryobacteraceae bacterium]|nr:cache domain-containing protein [Bryobacteraceae bacterium]
MVSQGSYLKIPTTKLFIGLLIALVPFCVIGLYTIQTAETALESTIGTHFQTIATNASSEIESFINNRVMSVGALAASPIIVDAVKQANRAGQGLSEDAFKTRILARENIWNSPASDEFIRQMLGNPASRAISRFRDIDRRFLRFTLTDSHGSTIAATHKTLDYFQGDEDFWNGIFANGRGAVHITDVLYDDVTKSNYIGLGVPVMDPDTNTFIGALDALVEVSTIFPILRRTEQGRSMRALLVKPDGIIITGPNIDLAANLKSEEFAAASEALATEAGRRRGFLIARLQSGSTALIAFASPNLAASYPNLKWTVLLAQDTKEAFSATRGVLRLIMFSVGVGLLLITFFGLYLSIYRGSGIVDIRQIPQQATKVETDVQE